MGDFNLNGGPYKIFGMILSFASKIFWNMLVFKIFKEGFMVNQPSQSVTKPKSELQLHLALQQYILSASAFYTKKTGMPIIFHMAPGKPVQLLWGGRAEL